MMKQALCFVVISVLGAQGAAPQPRAVTGNLQPENGLDRGEWGSVDLCPTGSYAFSFEIKYAEIGHADDTCVNAIKLYCENLSGVFTDYTISTEGSYGFWQGGAGMRTCPDREFYKGMRVNVVPDQGTFGDDLGVDNLQMKCGNNTVMDGLYGYIGIQPLSESQTGVVSRQRTIVEGREVEAVHVKVQTSATANDLGNWSQWLYCTPPNRICGHQVQFERESVATDDAAVSDVIMFCCD